MNLRQLEVFLSVCETLSITQTANQLYISQPAVSKTIKALENELQIPLFDSIDNRLLLNENGKLFRVKAYQLVLDFRQLQNFNDHFSQQIPLRIGTSLTIGNHSLPAAITQFQTLHPKISVKLFAENAIQIQHRLEAGEIDLAITEGFMTNQNFDKSIVSRYPLFLVCAPQNNLAKSGVIEAQHLLQQNFVLREKGSTLRDRFDELTHQLGIEVAPILESVNTEILIQAVKANLGITVLPLPLAQPSLDEGSLVRLNILSHPMETINYAVTHPGKIKSKIYQSVIDCFVAAEK